MDIEENPDPFITILTFTYPHESAIIKGRLESESIECFLKDELTVQVNNFYSNAIGGVKLQVHESDVAKARSILTEAGYLKEEDFKATKFELLVEDVVEKVRSFFSKL